MLSPDRARELDRDELKERAIQAFRLALGREERLIGVPLPDAIIDNLRLYTDIMMDIACEVEGAGRPKAFLALETARLELQKFAKKSRGINPESRALSDAIETYRNHVDTALGIERDVRTPAA